MPPRRLIVTPTVLVSLLIAALAGRGIALACMGAGCGGVSSRHGEVLADAAAPSAPAAGGGDRAAADQIFAERCAACHGADGSGKGPASGSLKPAPVNFHDQKWQKSVSDDTIAKAIIEGGASLGLSNQMMPNPDLEDQAGVVKELIARVRRYGK